MRLTENDAYNRASYGRIADQYAQFRPEYPPELFSGIFGHVGSFDRALDCATGTGQAAKHLIPKFTEVLAYDSSHGQVAHAYQARNMHRFVARSESLPLKSRTVDLVTVAQAVHWFDLAKFWPEVHRVAKPGAVVAIWGYGFFSVSDPNGQPGDTDKVVLETLREPVAPYWGSGNLILLQEYRTISFPFEELPAPKLDIVSHWTLDRLLQYVGTWSALNRYNEEHGPGLLQRARAELSANWGEGEIRKITMPITLRIGRVT